MYVRPENGPVVWSVYIAKMSNTRNELPGSVSGTWLKSWTLMSVPQVTPLSKERSNMTSLTPRSAHIT